MAPAKLKGVFLWGLVSPVTMYSSLFKALCSSSYWLWVSYPMGKGTLILKGSAICSATLAAAVKVLCSYCRVYLYLYPYCTMQYLPSECCSTI